LARYLAASAAATRASPSGKTGQHQIQQGQVKFFFLEGFQGLPAIGRPAHCESLAYQKLGERREELGLILD
jgi:hypothetical protein